jgi:hypothetical protein
MLRHTLFSEGEIAKQATPTTGRIIPVKQSADRFSGDQKITPIFAE